MITTTMSCFLQELRRSLSISQCNLIKLRVIRPTYRTYSHKNLPRGPCQGLLCLHTVTKQSDLFTRQSKICRRYSTDSEHSKKKPETTVNIPWWGRLLIVSCIGGAVYYTYRSAEHEKELDNELYRYKEFKEINLGGDWSLVDHNGNKRSSTDFRGQWIIMYMGFTHCPDICPEEMEKLGKIVKHFDETPKLPKLQPIFITLDPERDTPPVIKDYLRDFPSPRIVGFTGTEDEIKEVAKKFRAYFGKGPKDADNDYIVDHTIIIYLISPSGEFVNYYSRTRTAGEVIQSVTRHVEKYNELHKADGSF